MTVFAEMFITAGNLVFAFAMLVRDLCRDLSCAGARAAAKR